MELDQSKLQQACFKTARAILWAQQPVAVTRIQELAEIFYKDALGYEQFIADQNRDPNLITAAVKYLCNHHAIPPLSGDSKWFNDSLVMLIELCCPNQDSESNEEEFFKELEIGISVSRQSYQT
jgi:hypothetical protein